MRTHQVKLTFYHEDGAEIKEFQIQTPDEIETEDIERIINETHKALVTEEDDPNADNGYAEDGYCPETLVDQTCKRNDWSWKKMPYDLELEFK